MIEIILTAFIPCLAYVVLNRTSTSYYDLLAQTIINTALTGGVAIFIYHTTKDQVYGFIISLVGGALGNKYIEKLVKNYIDKKSK